MKRMPFVIAVSIICSSMLYAAPLPPVPVPKFRADTGKAKQKIACESGATESNVSFQ